MGSCPSNQILLKFKEVYIHANQHFHVAKQCQQIIGLHEQWLVPTASEKKLLLATSILELPSILSLKLDIISSELVPVFHSARQVKSNH